jgi:hypothetical protein
LLLRRLGFQIRQAPAPYIYIYIQVYASIAHALDSGRRFCPSRIFLRSCTDRDLCCHGAVPASNHCKKNDMWQPMLCSHPPPTRKRVLLFRTWSMSLWRRPDFPRETVATPSPGLCLRPHPNLWHESAHKIIEEYQPLQSKEAMTYCFFLACGLT